MPRGGPAVRHLRFARSWRPTLKLNLGCGFDKREGWLNVDNFPECEPDRLLDIEQTPWDLPSDSCDVVLMKHVLEHVGADFPTFKAVMQELYRILKPGGLLEVHVPHVRHDSYWADPTHVRAFLPLTFTMMSKAKNREWMEKRANFTMLAYALDVDFEVVKQVQKFDPQWMKRVESGKLTMDELREMGGLSWNVVRELQVLMRAVK